MTVEEVLLQLLYLVRCFQMDEDFLFLSRYAGLGERESQLRGSQLAGFSIREGKRSLNQVWFL